MDTRRLRRISIGLWIAFGLSGLILGYLTTKANAMVFCDSRDTVLKALSDKYQETGKAIGITGQVNLIEIFASKAGTWTILVTTPEGKSCILAAGSSWEELPETIAGKDT